MNNNLKPTENFSKSSFRLNNQSGPGARTCVSKEADCCVAPAHPPLPFRRNNMSPRLHTQKCKRAPRCHTRHWIYLKTAEMRFLDWIPYEKSFQNWNNKQQKKSKSDSCEDIYNSSEHAPPLRRAGHAWTAMVHWSFMSCYQPGEGGDSIHSEF